MAFAATGNVGTSSLKLTSWRARMRAMADTLGDVFWTCLSLMQYESASCMFFDYAFNSLEWTSGVFFRAARARGGAFSRGVVSFTKSSNNRRWAIAVSEMSLCGL